MIIGSQVIKMIEKPTDIHDGAKIGRNTIIRSFAVVHDEVEIGENVHIGHGSIIRSGTIIEDNVSIGSLNQIEGDCRIKEGTRFHSNVHISKASIIGQRCFIGPGFVPTNTPHPFCPEREKCIKGVTVEDDVKIGANVTTAPGITIGKNSLIGIGSVIIKDVEPNSFMFGNPAKRIKGVEEIKCPYNYVDRPYKVL
jgi:acetyltransferase-like isoleucine patch superfamily enzyme